MKTIKAASCALKDAERDAVVKKLEEKVRKLEDKKTFIPKKFVLLRKIHVNCPEEVLLEHGEENPKNSVVLLLPLKILI